MKRKIVVRLTGVVMFIGLFIGLMVVLLPPVYLVLMACPPDIGVIEFLLVLTPVMAPFMLGLTYWVEGLFAIAISLMLGVD